MPRFQPKKSLPLLEPSQPDWQISKLVPGGAGFLRLSNGQGAFAPGAFPGERIHVQQAEDHGGYLQATRWSLIEASPERVSAACPVQSRCGGCDLMALSYPAQVQAKLGILQDALTRTGRFETLPELSFVPSDSALAYRSRIRLHIVAGRLGFFAPQSRDLVEIPSCAVADAELNGALHTLRAVIAAHGAELALFSELELRVAPAGPRLAVRLIPAARQLEGGLRLIAALASHFQVSIAERASDPSLEQRFPLPGGVELRAPGPAFTQVNWPVNQRLVQAVLDGAIARAARSFCDLYCGAGNFSLPLLKHGLTGVGIEASKIAIGAAKRAATEQRLGAGRFIAGDVREALAKMPRTELFDLVVLDPPRSGARDILPELIRRAPRYIAYCACDPVTLARDLRVLCDAGYVLEQVTGFDMFPQTHHFETLVWLAQPSAA
ncbi:MAG: class I SAM-dependent RNA methyltransferase [Polyangiaceae bacterium]